MEFSRARFRFITLSIIFICLQSLTHGDERLNNKHLRRKRYAEMADDIRGPYCSTRIDEQCCPNRDDQCTVAILDTVCYCDVFCNETASDCCPDFWNICHGIDPPPLTRACQKDGAEFQPGHSIVENCNKCTCIFDPLFPDGFRWNCTRNVCMIQPEIIRAVNEGEMSWTAGNYSAFWGMTLDAGVRYRLGTIPPQANVLRMKPIKLTIAKDLPEQFDSREKWPNRIHPVRDQGNCGASWAFTTVATASDRLAIESQGILGEELSPQNLLSCNKARGQLGCDGGFLDKAWWFLRKKGVVSEECYPYASGQTDNAGSCEIPKKHDQYVVSCPNNARNSSGRVLYTTPPYRIANDELQIMQEIYNNGPVQAIMKVKEDLFMYQSGVYQYSQHVPDRLPDDDNRGYHSVRIIGWGVETDSNGNNTKYWLCINTWGVVWGEEGLFRIVKNVNESRKWKLILSTWGRRLVNLAPSDLCINSWGIEWGERGLLRIEKNKNQSNVQWFVAAARSKLVFYDWSFVEDDWTDEEDNRQNVFVNETYVDHSPNVSHGDPGTTRNDLYNLYTQIHNQRRRKKKRV